VHHPLRDGRLRKDAVLGGGARVGLDQDVRDRDVGAGPGERERVGPSEPARAAVTSATRPERSIASDMARS
jgi:hypothetical protein